MDTILDANPDAGMSYSQKAKRLLKFEGFSMSKEGRRDKVVPFESVE